MGGNEINHINHSHDHSGDKNSDSFSRLKERTANRKGDKNHSEIGAVGIERYLKMVLMAISWPQFYLREQD